MEETLKHIKNVFKKAKQFGKLLRLKAYTHDLSKLGGEEGRVFDEFTPLLKNTAYGSIDYYGYLEKMKPAIESHYRNNRHHPEHFANGIAGMNLVDVVEMFCDWLAAVERNENGDIFQSIEINAKRFNISDQLKQIFINSAKELRL